MKSLQALQNKEPVELSRPDRPNVSNKAHSWYTFTHSKSGVSPLNVFAHVHQTSNQHMSNSGRPSAVPKDYDTSNRLVLKAIQFGQSTY
jgi:hypothetical protein